MEYNSFLRALEEEIFSFLYRYTVVFKENERWEGTNYWIKLWGYQRLVNLIKG